ncbi:hypothetical protein BXZ70DRAFT_595786 [Cristinia sonorae]|uniref:MYND-type domain-containing protein n=1 Tax=Cristinia sonorae TaxID=1940300 RepID=A0A8K0XT13_9AGAR|nr:hypothetical protein BXZ70DRAFT_595786 [Cristinia sonorae]
MDPDFRIRLSAQDPATIGPQKPGEATCSYPTCPQRVRNLNGEIPSLPLAPLKCGRCKSAYYCDQACQKAHWRHHKDLCKAWSTTSASSGDISVAEVKVKMVELIQLIRSIPEYTQHLWRTYKQYKPQCARGFMEVSYDNFQQLFDAINLLKSFPVYDTVTFRGMPGTPTSMLVEPGEGGMASVGQSLQLRKLPGHQKMSFFQLVEGRMFYSSNDDRKNLQQALNMTQRADTKMFVISVHVALDGDYNTNIYDMIYEKLNYE